MNDRKEQSKLSWQTRILAQFIAAGYMTDGDNPAVEAAGKLAFDEIEAALIEEAEVHQVQHRDDIDATWTPDLPSESVVNSQGSFEKFRRATK